LLLGTSYSAPYSYSWTNRPKGSYSITAKAIDDSGTASISNALTVTVTGGAAQAFYIYTDHLTTPRQVVDEGNNIVWQWDQEDPFGSNFPTTNNGFVLNLRYLGQYFDAETNLHYNYYRDYEPQTGRYIQSDPIGFDGGINSYSYVGGSPLRYIDPLGLARNSVEAALQQAAIEGNVAEVQVIAETTGIADASTFLRLARANENKIIHIFRNPDHNLGPLIKACGSEGKALQAIRLSAEKAATVFLKGWSKECQ